MMTTQLLEHYFRYPDKFAPMKKMFLLLSFILLAMGTNAQSSKVGIFRIDVAAGLYTSKDVFTVIEYGNPHAWNKNSTATYFITTSFYQSKKLEVGVGLGYQKPYLEDPEISIDGGNNTAIQQIEYYTLMPQIRFNWVQSRDDIFEMYSSVGFALTFVNEKYIGNEAPGNFYPIPGAHLTGLGLRFGKKVAGFLEMGLGSKGIMSGGISVRL